jgi:hypothetical protein
LDREPTPSSSVQSIFIQGPVMIMDPHHHPSKGYSSKTPLSIVDQIPSSSIQRIFIQGSLLIVDQHPRLLIHPRPTLDLWNKVTTSSSFQRIFIQGSLWIVTNSIIYPKANCPIGPLWIVTNIIILSKAIHPSPTLDLWNR